MKYYKIEIDEEVRQYLLSKIEDFGDTPNTILRKELFQNKERAPINSSSLQFPSFPSGIPTALQHILEVIHLVKKRGLSRVDATKSVSKRHKVRRETVLDKYGRQLNKTTSEVDRLLEDRNLADFKRILKGKFPDHRNIIENFFIDLLKPGSFSPKNNNGDSSGNETESFRGFVSLDVLNTSSDQLSNRKPTSVLINDSEYEVNSWTEFDEVVIKWFLKNGTLKRTMLPINATSNKYFINSMPKHKIESYDGQWNKVDEGIFFDSKYNAPSHIRNVLRLIDQLSASQHCKIKLKVNP